MTTNVFIDGGHGPAGIEIAERLAGRQELSLIALDLEGVAVSTGSACSSGRLEPSHVLKAMGLGPHRTQSSIRFSLGLENTQDEIDRVLDILPPLVAKLRKLARSGARSRV